MQTHQLNSLNYTMHCMHGSTFKYCLTYVSAYWKQLMFRILANSFTSLTHINLKSFESHRRSSGEPCTLASIRDPAKPGTVRNQDIACT